MNENIDENKDSFKFAVTFLTALGAIVTGLYYFFQNSVLDISLFLPVMALTISLLISSFLFIGYILVKGLSPEYEKLHNKQRIKEIRFRELAPILYVSAFIIGATSAIYSIVSIIWVISTLKYSYGIFWLLIITFVILTISLFKNILKENKIIFVFVMVSTLILNLLFLYSYLPISPLFQGRVEIKMDNIYYKNEYPQIPITIEITGQKTDSSIYLYNKSSANKLNQIDKLTLVTNHNKLSNISGYNEILMGNVFASGKYYIFINTTNSNMNEGYYELVYLRSTDGYEYGKGFYLLNNRTTVH